MTEHAEPVPTPAALQPEGGGPARGWADSPHIGSAIAVLRLQATVGNAAVARMLRQPLGVHRRPADFAATPAAAMKSGWGFLAFGKTPWDAVLDALKAYAALKDDQHDARIAALQQFPAFIDAWEVHHKVGIATLNDDEKAKVAALATVRGLIASEFRELARVGVDESTQGIKAPRFKGDYLLEQVLQGKLTIVKKDHGVYVTKVQQALADASFLASDKVTGTLDDDTETALKAFQKGSGVPESGKVDKGTIGKLDIKFQDHSAERALAQAPGVGTKSSTAEFVWGSAPAPLTAGTRVLGADDTAAAKEAVKTSQSAGAGGALPTFVDPAGYETKLQALIVKLVESQFDRMAKGKASKRGASDLFDWAHIDSVAAKSKAATDGVFGQYAIGPPLQHGVGLHDAWDTKVKVLKDPAVAAGAADWRVDKLLTGDANVKKLDKEHGAIQTRAPEMAIVDKVRAAVVAAKKADLLEIHKAWPAFASDGNVNLQRFKADNDVANRGEMWHLFQTVVHEYLHTLEHSRHRAYRGTLDQQSGDFTLREGVVEYFTHTVLEGVTYDDTLRTLVEGPFHDASVKHPIPNYRGYGERANAEKLAGVVGARNVMAAFFLGDVDKIKGT